MDSGLGIVAGEFWTGDCRLFCSLCGLWTEVCVHYALNCGQEIEVSRLYNVDWGAVDCRQWIVL